MIAHALCILENKKVGTAWRFGIASRSERWRSDAKDDSESLNTSQQKCSVRSALSHEADAWRRDARSYSSHLARSLRPYIFLSLTYFHQPLILIDFNDFYDFSLGSAQPHGNSARKCRSFDEKQTKKPRALKRRKAAGRKRKYLNRCFLFTKTFQLVLSFS